MKTLVGLSLIVLVLAIGPVGAAPVSRTDASGYTYTTVQHQAAEGEILYSLSQTDPTGTMIWQRQFRDRNLGKDLIASLDLNEFDQVVLILKAARTGAEVKAIGYDRSGRMLWMRRNDPRFPPEPGANPQKSPPLELNRFPYQPGWPYVGAMDSWTTSQSINCFNVDADSPGKELILCQMPCVQGLRYDGRVMPGWPVSGFSFARGPAIIQESGVGKVCFGSGVGSGGRIWMYLPNGTPDTGWPCILQGDVNQSPVRADLDGNSSVDVIAGTGQANYAAHALTSQNTYLPDFPVPLHQNVTGIAVGDVNNDGEQEIVCSSMTLAAKRMWVIAHDGQILYTWQPNANIFGSQNCPSLADLDGDGDLEIMLTGSFDFLAWHHDGTPYWSTISHSGILSASPAIADLEGDGNLEIIYCCMDRLWVRNADGSVHAGHWPIYDPRIQWTWSIPEPQSPVVGDIDGDGEQEIVVNALSNNRWMILAFNPDGSLVDGFPCSEPVNYSPTCTPAITDIDEDGDVEIVSYGERHINPGANYFRVVVYDLGVPYDSTLMDWPMFCHDPQRTGCYGGNSARKISAQAARACIPHISRADFSLRADPNPFNPTTAISFELSVASFVKLAAYDIAGRLVATLVDGGREAGSHEVKFDGSGLPSGMYFAKLEAGKYTLVQKLVLMK